MIQVHFNNKKITFDSKLSLAELLVQQNCMATHFAVALNQNFIAKSQYASTYLVTGDSIDIIAPMQGG